PRRAARVREARRRPARFRAGAVVAPVAGISRLLRRDGVHPHRSRALARATQAGLAFRVTIEDGAVPSAEHVRGWLSAALGAADDDVVVTGPVYDGSHSRIFKASLPGLPFPVAVKQCRDPITGAPAPEEAEIQHAAL